MPKVVTEFKGDASGLIKTISSSKMQLGAFAKSAATIGSGMAGFEGAKGAISKLVETFDKIGAISDAAATIGLTNDQYQILATTFNLVDLSAQDMEKAVMTMNGKIGEAASGSDTANESLNKLGLTYAGLKNQNPGEQFETIAKAIAKLPTQAERAAAANDLYGKSGKKLEQVITKYDELSNKAIEAGNIISSGLVDAADQAAHDMTRLGEAFSALVASSGVVGFVTTVTEGMIKLTESVRGGISALVEMQSKLKGVGGQDTSGGTYGGSDSFWGSLWGNYSETGLFGMGPGEKSGAKLTTGAVTPAEQAEFKKQMIAKQQANEKAAADKKSMEADARKQLKAKEHAKDVEKTQKIIEDIDKKIKASDESAQKMNEDAKAEDAKQNTAQREHITDLEREIELQTLKNEGKQREAAIQEEINKAIDLGFSDKEAANNGAIAGQMWDLANKPQDKNPQEITDQLLRIGGSIGNSGNNNSQQISLQKQGNDLLVKVHGALISQTEIWERTIKNLEHN